MICFKEKSGLLLNRAFYQICKGKSNNISSIANPEPVVVLMEPANTNLPLSMDVEWGWGGEGGSDYPFGFPVGAMPVRVIQL